MPTILRPSGILLTLPAELRVVEGTPPPEATRRSSPGRTFGPVPMPGATATATDPLATAFGNQEMELLDQVRLAAATPVATARTQPSNSLTLEVPLAPHEDAAILLEQEGFYA